MKAQRAEFEVHSTIGSKTALVSKVCNIGLLSLAPALKAVLMYSQILRSFRSVLSCVTTLKK